MINRYVFYLIPMLICIQTPIMCGNDTINRHEYDSPLEDQLKYKQREHCSSRDTDESIERSWNRGSLSRQELYPYIKYAKGFFGWLIAAFMAWLVYYGSKKTKKNSEHLP